MIPFIKRLFKSIGPGFITGAADDDPSGIATYSQTGSIFGYTQLWTAPFSLPFMIAVQEMCGRIGMVTGSGLSGVIKRFYSKPVLYIAVLLLVVANAINIGADLGAMAAAVTLLIPANSTVILLGITLFTLLLEILVPYPLYARFLKYLTLSLLAYVAVAFMVMIDWTTVARYTFVPHIELSKVYILNIAALLGTTISPYLFFWQADEEVEEEIAGGKIVSEGVGIPQVTKKDMAGMRLDTAVGMIFSNTITFFIILTAAATLGTTGHTIDTAAKAAEILRPLAGDFAFLLFTLGILGTGLLAVPVLAGSAAYAVSEAVGWKAGLGLKFSKAKSFYLVIVATTCIGLLVNFLSIPPMTLLYYAAAINGMLAPPLLVLILLIGNNKQILGHRTNGWLSNTLGIIITLIMAVIAIALIASLLGFF